MKTKKLKTKLRLNKRTIVNMGNKTMNKVVGGAPSYDTMCETWGGESCNTFCYSVNPPAMCQDPSICDCSGPFETDCCALTPACSILEPCITNAVAPC